ncbi:MAG: DUF4437 domain-containing protein [Pseudomonadota bacterium]
MPLLRVRFLAVILMVLALPNGAPALEPTVEVIPRSEVQFQPLNPLRGDLSPKAGVLWGDIKKDVPTGTLIEFVDGFSSPPHIHNITYRAVVISGDVHNDDPGAEVLWMGPGSFWTQPAGENHITSARPGSRATAFLEILEGPYLVRPAAEEFDNGERPINIEARNVVWLNAADIGWLDPSATLGTADDVEIAFLWGRPESGKRNGTFLRLPAGFSGSLKGSGAWLRGVVISGRAIHDAPDKTGPQIQLDPGSYFGSTGGAVHAVSCAEGAPCLLYMTSEGRYETSAVKCPRHGQ